MSSGRATSLPGEDWVERVRAASDIVELVGQTVTLRRAGRNWVGLCPFHGEKTPSFSVNPERQFYHCFGCKAGGDVFKFVQETEKVGFLEAVELLSRRAGIAVPERRPGERGQRAGLFDALDAAAAAYEQWLADPERGAGARAYLERRGIARDTQRTFRLGLAPAGWDHLAVRLGGKFPEEVLVQAGLVARRDNARGVYDRFRERLVVPLVATGGVVVGFGARALGDDPPKYLNSPETAVYRKGSFLFALEQARRHIDPDGEVILVEGYFDAIALHQAGLGNVVATSGTALTTDHARLLRRLTNRVVLTFDGDAAGQDATLRSLGVLMAEGLDPLVVELPQGEDPDTFIRAQGLEGWGRARSQARDPVAFVQRHVARAPGGRDPREQGLQTMVRLASGVADPIRLRLLLERSAEAFGVGMGVLARAIQVHRGKGPASAVLPAEVARQRDRERSIESRLLTAVLLAPDALPDVTQWSDPEDFRDPLCRALAVRLWDGDDPMAAGDEVTLLARELQASGMAGLDWGAEARGAARRMHERRLREALQEHRNRLSHAAAGDETTRLMHEIREIQRSLSEWTA